MPNTTPHTFLPLTQLTIPADRQRQDFDPAALMELSSSISQYGLFHAVQVRLDGHTLVTGERRIRAILEHLVPLNKPYTYDGQPVPAGHIPVIAVSSDDPIVLEEIELDENLRRKDLTWKEMATTTARIDTLRQAQALRKAKAEGYVAQDVESTSLSRLLHTIAATAKEVRGSSIGSYQETTRQEILISKHLDKPEVAGASTLKDAFKALKRLEETDRNRALAIMVGSSYTAAVHQVIHANCLDWMEQEVNLGKFDVILTDPPYGIGAQNFGDGAGKLATIEHHYDDSYPTWQILMRAWAPLSYAITKPQAHAYIFCDIQNFHELKRMMEDTGWYVFRTPLTNYKRNSGRVPLPDQGPRRQSEWCLYAIKGKKQVTGIYSDVIVTDPDEQLGHGAQKPVALYEDLLKRSVRAGDSVVDMFAGTGTILPAAHTFKCYAVAVERELASYGKCLERLQSLDREPELPL